MHFVCKILDYIHLGKKFKEQNFLWLGISNIFFVDYPNEVSNHLDQPVIYLLLVQYKSGFLPSVLCFIVKSISLQLFRYVQLSKICFGLSKNASYISKRFEN